MQLLRPMELIGTGRLADSWSETAAGKNEKKMPEMLKRSHPDEANVADLKFSNH